MEIIKIRYIIFIDVTRKVKTSHVGRYFGIFLFSFSQSEKKVVFLKMHACVSLTAFFSCNSCRTAVASGDCTQPLQ